MITCNLMGGLGNQLFQIFTTLSYAMELHLTYKFLNTPSLGSGQATIRPTYWGDFLINLIPYLTTQFPPLLFIKEKGFYYSDLKPFILAQKNKDLNLFGYFQSYKYFDKFKQDIYNQLCIDIHKQNIMNKLQLNQQRLGKTISMHFRIGDYKPIQDKHPILTYNYYHDALNYILKKSKDKLIEEILFFCHDDDIDDTMIIINKLMQQFPTYKFCRAAPELCDWEQMLYMSLCKNNIIANSTFSWWGAYLNSNKNKIICYPESWFGPSQSLYTSDLFLNDWIQIFSDL